MAKPLAQKAYEMAEYFDGRGKPVEKVEVEGRKIVLVFRNEAGTSDGFDIVNFKEG